VLNCPLVHTICSSIAFVTLFWASVLVSRHGRDPLDLYFQLAIFSSIIVFIDYNLWQMFWGASSLLLAAITVWSSGSAPLPNVTALLPEILFLVYDDVQMTSNQNVTISGKGVCRLTSNNSLVTKADIVLFYANYMRHHNRAAS